MSGRRTVFDDVPGLRDLATGHEGVVRRDELLALGITHKHVAHQVKAGRWSTLGSNVVVLRTGILSRRQQMYAGCAHVGPRGALAGWTVLEERRLQGWDQPLVHTVVLHGHLPGRLPGVVVHQTRNLDAVDIARGPGPRSVTPARAAIDAAGWLRSARSASGLVLAVAQQKIATPAEMLDVLERIWRVRHTATLRGTLVEAMAGADSLAEVDVLRMMRSIGFREVRRQVRIELPLRTARIDLGVRLADGRTLLVQVDGPSHDDPRQRLEDQECDEALRALGYVVVRIPVALLRADPAAVRAQLRSYWMPQRHV
jgi:very-short-patch-repair endonuclease